MTYGFKEDFLQWVWQFKYFDLTDLRTTDGEPITIVAVGEKHAHSGPDFANAKIKIGETLWAGSVEVHLSSADWRLHRHDRDTSYDNVVLHVVWRDDLAPTRTNETAIACLTLEQRVAPELIQKYSRLVTAIEPIACARLLPEVQNMVREAWLARLTVERLAHKTNYLQQQSALQDGQIEEAFYQSLARSFGMQINAQPFEQLAASLPMSILAKNKHNRLSIEALLFGQAGFLEQNYTDDYPQQLRKEYRFLQKKYQLTPINGDSWKFLRLRPANFPTIRIAQFSDLVFRSLHLFSKIIATTELKAVYNLLYCEVQNPYWHSHYVFDKPSVVVREKHLGKTMQQLILVNTVVPFVFLYGSLRNEERLCDLALRWFEALPAEKNAVLEHWAAANIIPQNAAQAQALMHLFQNYCAPRRCLSCSIGNSIMKIK